jgi:tRNA-dihydrouridine synthase
MGVSFLLSPMAELSHRALRELIESFGGCDEYYTEMISAGGLLAGGPFEKWYQDGLPCPERLVYQLMGSDIDTIARAAALLDKERCLGVDINMGCSAPAIRRTGAGAAWMADIDRAGALIAAVRPRVKHRLSVKLRTGFQDDFDYLVRFCRRLEAEGVELITLHPRTAGEKFRRRARWEYVARLREALGISVAGNGDIADAGDLLRRAGSAARAGGASGPVMAGRAAVRQPWLFAHARILEAGGVPAAVDTEGTAFRFLDLLSQYQPPEFHLSRARRFFHYYCDNFTWAEYLRNRINKEESLAGIARILTDYFHKTNPGLDELGRYTK